MRDTVSAFPNISTTIRDPIAIQPVLTPIVTQPIRPTNASPPSDSPLSKAEKARAFCGNCKVLLKHQIALVRAASDISDKMGHADTNEQLANIAKRLGIDLEPYLLNPKHGKGHVCMSPLEKKDVSIFLRQKSGVAFVKQLIPVLRQDWMAQYMTQNLRIDPVTYQNAIQTLVEQLHINPSEIPVLPPPYQNQSTFAPTSNFSPQIPTFSQTYPSYFQQPQQIPQMPMQISPIQQQIHSPQITQQMHPQQMHSQQMFQHTYPPQIFPPQNAPNLPRNVKVAVSPTAVPIVFPVDCYATLRASFPEPHYLYFIHANHHLPIIDDTTLEIYWAYGGEDVIIAQLKRPRSLHGVMPGFGGNSQFDGDNHFGGDNTSNSDSSFDTGTPPNSSAYFLDTNFPSQMTMSNYGGYQASLGESQPFLEETPSKNQPSNLPPTTNHVLGVNKELDKASYPPKEANHPPKGASHPNHPPKETNYPPKEANHPPEAANHPPNDASLLPALCAMRFSLLTLSQEKAHNDANRAHDAGHPPNLVTCLLVSSPASQVSCDTLTALHVLRSILLELPQERPRREANCAHDASHPLKVLTNLQAPSLTFPASQDTFTASCVLRPRPLALPPEGRMHNEASRAYDASDPPNEENCAPKDANQPRDSEDARGAPCAPDFSGSAQVACDTPALRALRPHAERFSSKDPDHSGANPILEGHAARSDLSFLSRKRETETIELLLRILERSQPKQFIDFTNPPKKAIRRPTWFRTSAISRAENTQMRPSRS